MFGTRSLSLKAQVIEAFRAPAATARKGPIKEALIVSHGQPSNSQAGEDQLSALVARIKPVLPGWDLRSATMATPNALEDALEEFSGVPYVFPLFMADGWFTNTALPVRLRHRKVHQLSPLGVHPGLPHKTFKLLKLEAENRGWSFNSCDIMIAAHGSATGSAAAECALYFAKRLRRLTPFKKKVHTGFLAQTPFLSEVARVSTPRTLLLPFLAGLGSHLTDDIPQALKEGEFRGVLLPSVGEAEFLPGLIAHSLKSAELRSLAA
jgi:sirohydrochlorin ferrochelatase